MWCKIRARASATVLPNIQTQQNRDPVTKHNFLDKTASDILAISGNYALKYID